VYRSAASTDKTYETLHEVALRTPLGKWRFAWHCAVAVSAAVFALGAVAFAFTPLTGPGYVAVLMAVIGVVFGVRARRVFHERRRRLRLERAEDGSGHRIIVDGHAPLAFPLVAKRIDLVFEREGERFERVALHLEGADGGELLLRELPIALGGAWSDMISDGEVSAAVTPPDLEFEVSPGDTTDLLRRVNELEKR